MLTVNNIIQHFIWTKFKTSQKVEKKQEGPD